MKPRPRHRQQGVFHQPAVFRRILHALQYHPGAGGFDALYHFNGIEIDRRNSIGILTDGDLAGIILDQVARQLGGELGDARQAQQRMACELVADRERFERKVALQRVIPGRNHRGYCGDRIHDDFSWRFRMKWTARRSGSRISWRNFRAPWTSATTGSRGRSGTSTSPMASRPRQIGLIMG